MARACCCMRRPLLKATTTSFLQTTQSSLMEVLAVHFYSILFNSALFSALCGIICIRQPDRRLDTLAWATDCNEPPPNLSLSKRTLIIIIMAGVVFAAIIMIQSSAASSEPRVAVRGHLRATNLDQESGSLLLPGSRDSLRPGRRLRRLSNHLFLSNGSHVRATDS